MEKRKATILIAIGLAFYICSCSSFFEEDLSHYRVELNAPADSIYTVGENITFWWDCVNGATGYEFQIVSPKFDNVYRLIKDSLIANNKVIVDLDPGTYQWRVRAFNESSSTNFSVQSLFIRQADLNTKIDINQY